MVSVEGASAVEPAKVQSNNSMNNISQLLGDSKAKEECILESPTVLESNEIKSHLSSLEGVCQTAGFINSQNQQVKFPGNVRFVVRPVPEDEICRAELESLTKEGDGSSQPSLQYFTFMSADDSADAINGPYSTNSYFHYNFSNFQFQYFSTGFSGSDPQAQLTVRSMASIGLGSSNGRKIHLRRVHTTGTELVSPLLISHNGETIQMDSHQWIPTLT